MPADVPLLEFDGYSPRAQCAVGLISILSITERAIRKLTNPNSKRTLTNWDDFLKYARQQGLSFQSGRRRRFLDEFFIKDLTERAQLNGKNKDTSERISKLLSTITGTLYFSNGSLLADLLDEKLNLRDFVEFAKKLYQFSDENHFTVLMEKIQPEDRGQDALNHFLALAFGATAGRLRHPTFSSLDLLDIRAIKAEFHGMIQSSDANAGLFAVIREPRGWASKDPQETNILVRDILLLLPTEKGSETGRRGYYASVMDDATFIVEDVEPEDNTIVVSGRLSNT